MSETIDVLMATYNGEKFIEEQINSILSQTYTNIRLLILDDFSSDNTYSILKKYEKKDSRISIFTNNKNIGSLKTFEKLLQKVTSKYYMFSDQDDIWLPEKIEKSFNKLITDNSDLVFTDLKVIDSNKNLIAPSFNILKKYQKKALTFSDYRLVFLYNVVTGCTIISKSKYIKNLLPLPVHKDIYHDHIIALYIGLNYKISYLNEPTILYRQHSNNQIGSKRYINKLKNFYEIRNHLINVKINLFNFYLKYNYNFNNKKNLNKKALNYFKNIKNKKYINFKNLFIFYSLYKNETFKYFFINFIIMNFPLLGKLFSNFLK